MTDEQRAALDLIWELVDEAAARIPEMKVIPLAIVAGPEGIYFLQPPDLPTPHRLRAAEWYDGARNFRCGVFSDETTRGNGGDTK